MSTLVIGASGAIGRACIKALGDERAVVAADLQKPDVGNAHSVSLDVTNQSQVDSVLRELDREEQITGLIYAAGLNTTGLLNTIDWKEYEAVMSVNLRGAFHVGSSIISLIHKSPRKFDSVFISSTAGLVGEAGGSIYCASKFGLIGFTQSFAGELAPLNGRANVVCPGNVDSPMLTELAAQIGAREGKSGEQTLKQWSDSSAIKRLITPEEVAKTCVWLLSDESSGISGQTIVVDGPRA